MLFNFHRMPGLAGIKRHPNVISSLMMYCTFDFATSQYDCFVDFVSTRHLQWYVVNKGLILHKSKGIAYYICGAN